MDAEDPCIVNRAVRRALRDARADYEARGVLVVPALEATHAPATHDETVYRAVYTIFRALAARLPRGAVLHVATADRAGDDVELTWEAREDARVRAEGDTADEEARSVLRQGPYGDLLEVAVGGLVEVCRARAVLTESPATPLPRVFGQPERLDVRRRYSFLIPSLRRGETLHAGPGRPPPGERDGVT